MRQGQARQGGGGKSKRRVTSKDSLFHHHHPNFYDFFPKAIVPFTGSDNEVIMKEIIIRTGVYIKMYNNSSFRDN